MKARFGAWLERLGDQFWLRPGLVVVGCMAAAQGGSGSAFVLIRMLDVMAKVVHVERATDRLAELGRHADLVLAAGERHLEDVDALADLRHRMDAFRAVVDGGPKQVEVSSLA